MENTLIVFLSDNGACALDFTREETRENMIPPWDPQSFWACGPEWAHLSNTPFRLYKSDMHEGGIASPLIVHWPAGITGIDPGAFVRERTHIVDLLATFLDAADAAYPARWDGAEIAPHRGVSLLPPLDGRPWIVPVERWNGLYGSNGFTRWPWKLSRSADETFALYNLEDDRCETVDLKNHRPEDFLRLRRRFTEFDAELESGRTERNFNKFKDREP
jgi:arylsulfatase